MTKSNEFSLTGHGLNVDEKSNADNELLKTRLANLSKIGDQEKIYASLVSLKFNLVEYIDLGIFSEKYLFSEFLKIYVSILSVSKRQLASDLSIHETQFSRMVNNKENPGVSILYRIEEHSNQLIPASLLWKIVNMKLANEIECNISDRKKQSKLVKNKFQLKTA